VSALYHNWGLTQYLPSGDASGIMPKRPSKRPPHADLNQLAKSIVDQTTSIRSPHFASRRESAIIKASWLSTCFWAVFAFF
jgi:hypothetical protein